VSQAELLGLLRDLKDLLTKLTNALESVAADTVRVSDAGGSLTVDGTVDVGNFPTDYPDSTAHSKLDDICARLLDIEVDKVLGRSDFVRVGGSDYAATPAYHEAMVDADGHVHVDVENLPASYPLPDAQVSDLKKVSVENIALDADNHPQVDVLSLPNPSNLDVALSTRASEDTLSGIKSQTDKLLFDADNHLQVDVNNFPADYPDATAHSKLDELRRTVHSAPPASGKGAAWPMDSPWHWEDTAGYTVTETSWAEVTVCRPRPGWLPTRSFMIEWGVRARIDTAGEELHVRLRSEWRGTLAELTFTSTEYTDRYERVSIVLQGWEHDQLFVEAYVTGGTGYIEWTKLHFIPIRALEGWEGTHGVGEFFHPLKVDADGRLEVVVVGCLTG